MTKDRKIQSSENEIIEGKIYAILAYLWILCIIPLLLKKDNDFVYFHGKQGLVLFIASLGSVIIYIVPLIGWIIGSILLYIILILSFLGILMVLAGKYWKFPFIGDIAEKIIL